MIGLAVGVVLLSTGYGVGRSRPVRRVVDWAHWQAIGKRPTGTRYAAMWAILSAENIAWVVSHPVAAARAWRRRNDPPPPRGPAPQVNTHWPAGRRDAGE
jgi:hypothetical protein